MTGPLDDLLPHRAPMLLLEGGDGEGAYVRVDPGAWYADETGAMPGWFGLELMGQAVAARRPEGSQGRPGYLVGTRAYRSIAAFPGGSLLRMRILGSEEDESGLAAYDCEILLHGESVATAVLKVIRP